MKEKIIKFLEKASIDVVEKRASHWFYGENKIPKVILDEIKENKKRK